MKNLDYYMSLPYKMEVVPDIDEGGYIISFPELKGCLTCVENFSDIQNVANEAKKTWFEACLEENINIPEPEANEKYSGQFKLRIPKSLHRELAIRAKQDGISMNQYCVYLLSR